ncbi:MAG: hypothetical protein RLZZ490_1616 [Cyanobacteriota bacterium]|jgi:hypothetical protein
MAGLFGLFGKRTKYVDEVDNTPQPQAEKKEAFFLEADDAKSLGDVEYMRKPIQIKRSFPKTLNSGGAEVVKEISALEIKPVQANGQPQPSTSSITAAAPQPSPVNNERRSSDNNLDMFRQMAKEIKK